MHKTFDFRLRFPTFDPAVAGVCQIRVFQTRDPEPGRPPVIVASQVAGSPASVTNFAEELAAGLIRSHGQRIGLRPGAEAPRLVWVEHYPHGTRAIIAEEAFHVVTFTRRPGGMLAALKWESVTRDAVEHSIIRAPLGD